MLDVAAFLQAFAAVFPAELPDKTMVVTIVLVARYRRPLAVWCGTSAAYILHVAVAVAAGSLLALLPDLAVRAGTATLFTVGAVLMWRSAASGADEAPSQTDPDEAADTVSPLRVALASFGLVALAEWGDMSQLIVAGLAGSTGSPVATGLGGLTALLAVSGLAVTVGRGLVQRLELARLQRAAAAVFLVLAVVTALGVV